MAGAKGAGKTAEAGLAAALAGCMEVVEGPDPAGDSWAVRREEDPFPSHLFRVAAAAGGHHGEGEEGARRGRLEIESAASLVHSAWGRVQQQKAVNKN